MSTRRFTHLPAVVAVIAIAALALTLSACGATAPKSTPARPAHQPAPSRAGGGQGANGQGANGQDASPADRSLHGIIVKTGYLIADNDAEFTLSAYDPSSGAVTGTRTFRFPDSIAQSSGGVDMTSAAHRTSFNSDFTLYAGTIGDDAHHHAGAVDTDGVFNDLTPPKGTGYTAQTPLESALGFDPASGRMWFENAAGSTVNPYGSVDPSAGASSTTYAKSLPPALLEAANTSDFDAISPDGKLDVSSGEEFGPFSMSADGSAANSPQLSSSASLVPAPAHGAGVIGWVDDRSYIAYAGSSGGETGAVYKVSVSADLRHASVITLAPPGHEGDVQGAVADPTHQQVALLIKNADDSESLYLVSADGSGLHKLGDLTVGGGGPFLVAWTSATGTGTGTASTSASQTP